MNIFLDTAELEEFNSRTTESLTRVGVKLTPDQSIDIIEPWLDQIDLIELHFPTFADGRAFSQARLLRIRYHFEGDIRASGEIVQDQLAFMLSCGFNQFELAPGSKPLDFDKAWTDVHRFENNLSATVDDGSAGFKQTGT